MREYFHRSTRAKKIPHWAGSLVGMKKPAQGGLGDYLVDAGGGGADGICITIGDDWGA